MICPECGSKEHRQIGHETLCLSCGLVLDDAPLENHSLTSGPVSQPYLARAGTFQYEGRIVKTAWLMSTKQKNFQAIKRQIQVIGSSLKISDKIIQEAVVLFKKASDNDINRGRSNSELAFACVYAACQVYGVPRTPLEVTAYTSVGTKKLLRAYRYLVRGLNLRVPITKPIDLLHRFGSRLELNPETISKAAEILEISRGTPVRGGKRPETLVASALYFAGQITGETRTQREIANTVGVIEVTIRRTTKALKEIYSN